MSLTRPFRMWPLSLHHHLLPPSPFELSISEKPSLTLHAFSDSWDSRRVCYTIFAWLIPILEFLEIPYPMEIPLTPPNLGEDTLPFRAPCTSFHCLLLHYSVLTSLSLLPTQDSQFQESRDHIQLLARPQHKSWNRETLKPITGMFRRKELFLLFFIIEKERE